MTRTTEMKADVTQPQPLRLSRTLHARPETVFKAWSSAEHIKRWFSPDPLTVPQAKVEMRVGEAPSRSARARRAARTTGRAAPSSRWRPTPVW